MVGRGASWRRLALRAAGIAGMFLVGFSLVWLGSGSIEPLPPDLGRHAPVVVAPEPRLPPVTVEPPRKHPVFDFDFGLEKPLLLRRRLPVQITMYCLQGRTRTDSPVRQGIVAADPRVLPLGTVIDLYVGLRYAGRFLVDDTGGVVKGAIIDVWTPSCQDARRFGRRRGAVVIVEPTRRRRR